MSGGRRRGAPVLAAALFAALTASCGRDQNPATQTFSWPAGESAGIDEALTPPASAELRDGLAAAILVDVSGSMAQAPKGASEPKIVSARRAALDLVEQFARYADDHPGEAVRLGIYEFSRRQNAPDTREIIPMGPPDRARAAAAVAAMRANGGTPIGSAVIAGKRALDATGLVRRHLLVVTDGENTDGFPPERVAAGIARRPEIERPSLYFVAFDIGARRFAGVKDAGALVLEAADGRALNATLDSLLRGQILVER